MSGRESWSEMGKKRWNEAAVIAEIRALAEKYGRAKSTADDSLYHAARKLFGSWNEACKVAEVTPARPKPCGKVMKNCLLYDSENKACKGLLELVCARKKCSFYKRANKANREDYAKDMALIDLARRK